MKIVIQSLSVVILLGILGCDSSMKSEPEKFTVDGLSVIIKEIPEADIVSVGFYLNGGVAYTPVNQAGIEEFLLSVAIKGSEKYDKETLQGLTESMGTRITANADRDNSSISLRCLSEQFEKSWDIYQDVILNPSFDTTEIELVRTNQLSNIRRVKDNPDTFLNKIAREFYYKGHPYAISTNGNETTVQGFQQRDLINYHEKHFTKSRSLLVVVGNISKSQIAEFTKQLAAGLSMGGPYTDKLPAGWEKTVSAIEVVESEMPIPTNYIIGQTHAPNKLSPDYYAFQLASRKLATRVFEEVRTKRNLSYAPAAGYRGGNTSNSYLYVTTSQPDTTIKVMFAEVDRLKENLLSEDEMNELRMMFLTRYYMSGETVAAQQGVLANYELSGAGFEKAGEFMREIQAVTAEDIQRVSRKYLENYQFAYLGDPKQVNKNIFLSYVWPKGQAEGK